MKRIIIFVFILSVLFCGCRNYTPTQSVYISFSISDSNLIDKCSDIISKRLDLAGYKNAVTANNNKIEVTFKAESTSDDFQNILSMTGDFSITGECDISLTKDDIRTAKTIKDDNGNNVIELTFTKDGKEKFAMLTEKSSFTKISLDDKICSPSTHGRMEVDSILITGFMNDELTEEKAKFYAAIIMSDKLPCSLTY